MLIEQDLRAHTSEMILDEILEVISDTEGSPAEYSAIRERLSLVKITPNES